MKQNLFLVILTITCIVIAPMLAIASTESRYSAEPKGLWIAPEQYSLELEKELPLPKAIESLMWAKNMVKFEERQDRPLIAIVIDDMGVDKKRSAAMLENMPPEVTVAYLPYAEKVASQVKLARKGGHEIIVHLPMQPESNTIDPGPNFLGVGFSPEELHKRIKKNLSAFRGYAGVNNHMGSKFTQDKSGINILMEEISARGLYFLDSRTIAGSVAENIAQEKGVPTSHRDVFLDDTETKEFTEQALAKLEAVARRKGTAIAIGHPKDITLEGLKAWIPTLEAKGFQLAPLSAVIRRRQKEAFTKDKIAHAKINEIGVCEIK